MTINRSLFDKWTPAHIAAGMLASHLGISFQAYAVIALGYEIGESQLEAPGGSRVFGTKRPETKKNVAGDMGAGFLGYYLATEMIKAKLPGPKV